jgi:hypothetical protein
MGTSGNPATSAAAGTPVFVVGSYRSGTSIFCWCLGQHPNLVNLPETNWLARLSVDLDELYRLATVNGEFSHLGAVGASRDEFYRLMGEGVEHLMQVTNLLMIERAEQKETRGAMLRRLSPHDPKRRWVDATPENSHYVYGLAKLFPGARFIHLLRDPDDVTRSLMHFARTGSNARNYPEDEGYRTWMRLTQASFKAEQALGSARMMRLRYEDLIGTPEASLRRVLAFIGEGYNADCLKPLDLKINSSEVDRGSVKLERTSAAAREAEVLYREILAAPVPAPEGDTAAYTGIEQAFLQYCRDVKQARSNA